jgi:uncharacterized membrane protein YqjE
VQRLPPGFPHLVSDRIELLSLELERAGQALARIVVYVVAAAVLGVTAWLAAWAVVFMLLLMAGLPPVAALALVLLFNALAAWLALRRARKSVGLLSLPATRRHLTVSAAKEPADGAQPRTAPPQARADGAAATVHPAPVSSVPHVHDSQRNLAAGAR